MNLLSLETSTKNYSLAVLKAGKIVSQKNTKLKKVLSSSIIPAVESVLKKAKLLLGDIDCFVVGLGPGSFTSLRVGLSTVKGLAFVLGKPVIGVPSLDAVAARQKVPEGYDTCVILDAKRNFVYACIYEKQNGVLNLKIPYLLCSMDVLLKKINKNTHFTGDGVKLFKEDITKRLKKRATFAEEKDWHPQAKHLALLAQKRALNGQFDRADTLVPLYLYPDDCQVEKK